VLTLATGLYGDEFNIYPSIGFLISGGEPFFGKFLLFCSAYFYKGETFMKGFLRSKLVMTIAALIMIAAAVIVSFSGAITHSHAAPASSGALWATGHDADLHCASTNGGNQCHYFQIAVTFVRNGSTLPILALDHRTEVATAISNAFGSSAPTVTTVDPRTGFAALPLVNSTGKPLYSAMIIASDITCLGCDNNNGVGDTPDSDAINARAADIKTFFNAGGGILALAGAKNISVFYNFLPISVTAIPVSPPNGPPGGFTLTSVGVSLGLTNSDINCCRTHNSFQLPASGSPLQVAEKDSAGNAETLIAKPSTPPPPPHRQLIIFLQGINTDLNGKQANKGEIVGMGSIPSTVKMAFPGASTKPDASTRFLEYSYFISRTDNGLPGAYNCADTFTNPILRDIKLLDKQIKNALKVEPAGAIVDIYLIGHSLGGVVAFGYLGLLEEKLGVSLPSGVHLKAVITLDSPIGGVPGGLFGSYSKFLKIIATKHLGISHFPCEGLTGLPLNSVDDFARIFNSTSKTTTPDDSIGPDPQGAQASVLAISGVKLEFPFLIPSNEFLAEQAQVDLGTSFLAIGNKDDFLWRPRGCAASLIPLAPALLAILPAIPSFIRTQWLEDEGHGSGLYGRSFTTNGICGAATVTNELNHLDVLSNTEVNNALIHFLSPTVGGTPNPLNPEPSKDEGPN